MIVEGPQNFEYKGTLSVFSNGLVENVTSTPFG